MLRREDVVDTRHDVAIVPAAQIVLVRGSEGSSPATAAARIGEQYRPTVTDQEVDIRREAIKILIRGSAVHFNNQRYGAVRGFRRQGEQAIYSQSLIVPVNT